MEFDLNKKYCYYFKQISDIPRGSRNEKGISDYVVEFAKKKGYRYIQDDVYNVIVYKPASKGYEDSEPIILQAHMDMVCEKNKDVEHDFEKDPLDLYVEDGWLKARGTTLGADDGQGVAYMLAVLDDDTLEHPPLECAFTVMEEIGLFGAIALKKEYFNAKRYINLDSGGEVVTCVTSSGGARAVISKDLSFEENDKNTYRLEIRGLKGGHSAGCIHLELGNGILLAARVAEELRTQFEDLRIVDFNGGMKFNAIPREADLTFVTDADPDELQKAAKLSFDSIAQELQYSDERFYGNIIPINKAKKAIDKKQSDEILSFMYVMPNGLQHKSMAIEGLTVASLNAGVAYIKDGKFFIDDLIRSAAPSHGDIMIHQLEILCPMFNFNFSVHDRYYGWNYSKDSEMRKIMKEVLEERGVELKERATHGGLECGIFKGLIPELDIITLGPIAKGEHTPDERLDLASFDRAYGDLLEVLKRSK